MITNISLPRSGRFTTILAAIAVATLIGMTALLLWQLRARDLREAEAGTISLSHIIAEQTARSLQGVDLALDVALDRLEQAKRLGVAVDDVAIHVMLRSRVEVMPQLRSMFIVNANGTITSSALTHPAPAFSVKDRDYFTVLRDQPDRDLFVSSTTINRIDNKQTFFISRRIRAAKGKFAGIVVASVDIDHIEALYDSINVNRAGSPIALRLNDGTLIARAPREKQEIPRQTSLPAIESTGKGQPPFRTIRTEGADAGITTYRRISGFPMMLSVGQKDQEALAGWRDSAGLIVIGAGSNILLLIAATTVLLRRQRREEQLSIAAQESGHQLSAMVNSAMDAIVTIDNDYRIVVFNPAAERMFGYDKGQVVGKPLDMLMPERFRESHQHNVAAFSHSAVNARMKDIRRDIVGLRADGSEFPIESTIARVRVDGKTMYTAILRDIGDRRRAEDELRESHRQLRELASSLQAVREEERTSIARELHDELGQQLLRLRMDLSWLSSRTKELSPGINEKLAEMKQFITGTVNTLRHVTTRLRPPLLDDLGLAEAAQWQLTDFERQAGIAVIKNINIDEDTLDELTAINVFRILQESLTNVARHANATQVSASLLTGPDGLLLEIRDNGSGAAFEGKAGLGHGLVGIRERTLMLGGEMEILTEPGRGFLIRIHIPRNEKITEET